VVGILFLCTNGMFYSQTPCMSLKPTFQLFSLTCTSTAWNERMICAWRKMACFREAIEGIKGRQGRGVSWSARNTTIYKETDLNEIADLYDYLDSLGASTGLCFSPGVWIFRGADPGYFHVARGHSRKVS